MSKRKVFSLIGLIMMVLLIVSLYLPFMGDGDVSYSLWKMMDLKDMMYLNIIMLIELILAALVFLLQLCGAFQDTKLALFSLGYFFTELFGTAIGMIKNETFKYLSVGFYLGFIISVVAIVFVIVGSKLSNEAKPKYYGYQGYGPQPQPMGFDPKTGQPIYGQPEPKQPIGYDPNTGEPIYK